MARKKKKKSNLAQIEYKGSKMISSVIDKGNVFEKYFICPRNHISEKRHFRIILQKRN